MKTDELFKEFSVYESCLTLARNALKFKNANTFFDEVIILLFMRFSFQLFSNWKAKNAKQLLL